MTTEFNQTHLHGAPVTLVTGAAGFIGFHVARALLDRGELVYGIDNLNDYYDPSLKSARLKLLDGRKGFNFEKIDVADTPRIADLFQRLRPTKVIHLAAQAGVRYSLENPKAYVDANLVGFANILEGARHHSIAHLTYASSSSVYGANSVVPFSTTQRTDHPISLYAATKKANEVMAFAYSHLYGIPATGLRFFTVYGPWGRPDMALFLFTQAILEGRPIKVFNHGQMRRDFTYIDDIVEGVIRTHDQTPRLTSEQEGHDTISSRAPYRLYNIGNNTSVPLMTLIAHLEQALGCTAQLDLLPLQQGDVPETFADVDDLVADVGFRPTTPIDIGVRNFVEWYRDFYKV